MNDPRVDLRLLTVTLVEVTPDLREARVYVSLIGSDANERTALRGLDSARRRMRAELGPPAHDLHDAGPDLVMTHTLGSDVMGPRSMSLFSTFFWMNRAYRSQPMPHELEGFKIAERTGMRMRPLAWAMILAASSSPSARYLLAMAFRSLRIL